MSYPGLLGRGGDGDELGVAAVLDLLAGDEGGRGVHQGDAGEDGGQPVEDHHGGGPYLGIFTPWDGLPNSKISGPHVNQWASLYCLHFTKICEFTYKFLRGEGDFLMLAGKF